MSERLDPITLGIEAQKTWTMLATKIPAIRECLTPRTTKSGIRIAPKSKPPIALAASDLLRDISQEATFYLMVLSEDDPRFEPAIALTDRCLQLANRHGHFTLERDRTSSDFLDAATELVRRAVVLIERPPEPNWRGPCLANECDGDMWGLDGKAPQCDECGSTISDEAWRAELMARLDSRLMTREELAPALKMLTIKASPDAINGWIKRKRLQPVIVESGLFRLADAIECAGARGKHVRARP